MKRTGRHKLHLMNTAARLMLITVMIISSGSVFAQAGIPVESARERLEAPQTPAATGSVTPPNGSAAGSVSTGAALQPDAPRYKDLYTLFQEEWRRQVEQGTYRGQALLSIRSTSDGSFEVLSGQGELLQSYPEGHFWVKSMVSEEVLERKRQLAEARAAGTANDAEVGETETAEEELSPEEAARQERQKQYAAEMDRYEALKEGSRTYRDPRSGEDIEALRIDARRIREDGTYDMDGEVVRPVRVFNWATGMHENVVPISPPAAPK